MIKKCIFQCYFYIFFQLTVLCSLWDNYVFFFVMNITFSTALLFNGCWFQMRADINREFFVKCMLWHWTKKVFCFVVCLVAVVIKFFGNFSWYRKMENRMPAMFDLKSIHPRTLLKCVITTNNKEMREWQIWSPSKDFRRRIQNIYKSDRIPKAFQAGQHAVERDIASQANRPGQLLLRLHAVQIRSSGATTALKTNQPVYNYVACVFSHLIYREREFVSVAGTKAKF